MAVLISRKKHVPLWIYPLTALLAAGIGLLIWRFQAVGYGHLQLRVVDAYTLSPLEGAHVVIAGEDREIITDSGGEAAFMGLPIPSHPTLEEAGFGEYAVLALMEGYRPTVLFYAHIYEGRVRRTTLYMFPEEADGEEIITVSETPDEDWLTEFVEKYSP